MVVRMFLGFFRPSESVHIELADKGSQIVVFEIGRKCIRDEMRRVDNAEAITILRPCNGFWVQLFLNVMKRVL